MSLNGGWVMVQEQVDGAAAPTRVMTMPGTAALKLSGDLAALLSSGARRVGAASLQRGRPRAALVRR